MLWCAGPRTAEVPPTVFKYKLAHEFPTLQLNGWKVGQHCQLHTGHACLRSACSRSAAALL
jgi:hypothetical protein